MDLAFTNTVVLGVRESGHVLQVRNFTVVMCAALELSVSQGCPRSRLRKRS
jgi:hypothetical protein